MLECYDGNMGANPEQSIADRRREIAQTRAAPVETVTRDVVQQHSSLYANIPPLAQTLLDLSADDKLQVEQFDDRIVLRPLEDSDA